MCLKLIQAFAFCLVLGAITPSIDGADCVLPLPRFRFFAPLIFSTDGELLPTDNNDEHALKITVPVGQKVKLSCAPNYFKKPIYNASNWLTARCVDGEQFDINGVESNWMDDLGCEVRPVEEILKPIPGCSNNATSVEFGFENPIKQETQVIGEACYSESEGRTIFVHTKFVNKYEKTSAVLETETANYLKQKHPESGYKIEFLVAARLDELNVRLEKLLSSKKVPFLEHRHFIDLPMLQNGQLYSALKLGWNFVVTNGFDHLPNYDSLLKDIMGLGEKSFDLYLGTHEVLSVDAGERSVEIHLLPDQGKYPVPKFLWGVVATDSGKAAAFLISNDIEASEEDLTLNAPCESKCTQLPWLSNLSENNGHKNPRNGYVFCCELEEFMESVPEMPALEGKYKLLQSDKNFNNDIELLQTKPGHFTNCSCLISN